MIALHSESCTKIFEALREVQRSMDDAPKDKTNPHFKTQYASLTSLRKVLKNPLAENGLSYTQVTYPEGKDLYLQTILKHSSGEWIRSIMVVGSGTPQQIGSALTYFKRYSLAAITGNAPDEDDDASHAMSGEQKNKSKAKPRAQDPKTVTPEQLTRLYTIVGASGWSAEEAKNLIHSFGYESSKDIRKADYDVIIQEIESKPKEEKK